MTKVGCEKARGEGGDCRGGEKVGTSKRREGTVLVSCKTTPTFGEKKNTRTEGVGRLNQGGSQLTDRSGADLKEGEDQKTIYDWLQSCSPNLSGVLGETDDAGAL